MSQKILAIIQSHKSKLTLKLNKPGICILELSKVSMHEFHYDYIKNKYNNKSKLLPTDTYSLMYEIKTEDAYDDICSDKEMLDHGLLNNGIICHILKVKIKRPVFRKLSVMNL